MGNALAELRKLVAPASRRRTATVVRLLPGGKVELSVAGDTSGQAADGATAARPVVYCGVVVAAGDRVLVEGDRVVSRIMRETEQTVRIV
jgi:hypothetical protein